jgi:hypothetical protein
MPIFYLELRGGDTSDRSWEATYLREGCWTEAKTELIAREKVAGATLQMMDVRAGSAPQGLFALDTASAYRLQTREAAPRYSGRDI